MNIPGPAGCLEAAWDRVSDSSGDVIADVPVAILCHPHPQYGGNMHDAVLATTSQALVKMGISCLRFNFRGVGASEGSYDNGSGEREDLLAVQTWAQADNPLLKAPGKVWWAGYSFGSSIVWHALTGLTPARQPAKALLIAPPMRMMDFEAPSPALDLSHISAIAGDADDFADTEKLTGLLSERAEIIPGADHFFGGKHDELGAAVHRLLA